MKNKRKLWLIVAIVTMIGLAFAFTACDPNNSDQNCSTCGKFPCECPTSSACVHVFADNWQTATSASWCVDGVCGNGTQTRICKKDDCTETQIRNTPCLGTQGLVFVSVNGGEAYEVGEGDNFTLGIIQVCIPDYHNSKPVIGIGSWAFMDMNTEIACEIMESVRIGANITYIGESTFENCYSLETVIFAEGSQLETIGIFAFAWTAITGITIPAGVTSIGGWAFFDCTSLETVTVLATTPPELGERAFYIIGVGNLGIMNPSLMIRVPESSVDAYKTHPDWAKYEHLIIAIQ